MALEKTIKQFAFAQGFDTKIASEVTPIGKLHALENARMDRAGVIQKKYGITPMTITVSPSASFGIGTLQEISRTIEHKDSLFALVKNVTLTTPAVVGAEMAYRYDSSLDKWAPLGASVGSGYTPPGVVSCIASAVDVADITSGNNIPDYVDMAVIGNVACVIKHFQAGDLVITLMDLPSKEVIITYRPAFSSGGGNVSKSCRVIAFNNKFYVFYTPSATNNLRIDEFDPVLATRTDTRIVVSNLYYEVTGGVTNSFFDVVVAPSGGTKVYLIYRADNSPGASTNNVVTFSSLTPPTIVNSYSTGANLIDSC